MCISILSISNSPVEMRSGNVQLDKNYCLCLIIKATDEYLHLTAMSVVRPEYATTPHPIFLIGQATKKPTNRRVAGEGEGGKDDAILL